MADVLSTAMFRALADFSSLVSQSGRAKGALAGVETQANRTFGSRLQGQLSARGKQMQDLGRTTTLRVTAPIVGLGGAMVHTFSNFELSITKAAGKAGATGKEFKQMQALAIKMGRDTMFSAQDAADALDNLAALGFNARDSMKALPGVMLAAQASGEDLAKTADVVAKAINAFGLKAKDANHVADVFAQTSNNTALDMQGLAYVMANAGEVGSRFGQSLESVTAWAGRLADMGVPAHSAGVAIRQALVSLSAPTQKQAALMESLGIKTRDAQGKMLPIPQLLENMQKGLSATNPKMAGFSEIVGMSQDKLKDWAKQNGFTTSQAQDLQTAVTAGGNAFKDYATKALFGVEGAKGVSLAISQGHPVVLQSQKDAKKLTQLQDGLAKTMGVKAAKAWIAARTQQGKFTARGADAVKALTAMNTSADGVAKTFADRLGKTTAFQIDQIKGSLETAAIMLIKTFIPDVKQAIKWLTKMVNKISDWANQHPDAAKWVVFGAAIVAALGPALIVLGTLLRLASGVVKVGRGLGKVAGAVARGGLRALGIRRPKADPAATGGTGAAASTEVWWAKAMPVYLTEPLPTDGSHPDAGKGGKGASGGGPRVNPKTGGVVLQPGGVYGPLTQAEDKSVRRKARRARVGGAVKRGAGAVGRGIKGGARAVGRAGAAGVAAGAYTLASGGSLKDAIKQMATFAAIELAVANAAKVWAAAQWLLNAAMDANPIGAVIAIIALLVLGVIEAYKHFKWFRDAVNAAWDGIKAAAIWVWNHVYQPIFKALGDAIARIIRFFGDMLQAMSHVPGFGWAKGAADAMYNAAKKAQALADGIKKIPDHKNVSVGIGVWYTSKKGQKVLEGLQAHQQSRLDRMGGSGLASGTRNWRGGWTWVGEDGPEMLRLPRGSEVVPHRESLRMAAGLLGGGPARHRVRASGALGRLPVASGAGRRGGDLYVTVHNPVPERAGQSVSRVLSSRAFEKGWTPA